MNLELLAYADSRTLAIKRENILQKSRDLFIDLGIEQTSMKMIADYSEITRRSLYNYYESKDTIAADVQILNLDELHFFKVWGDVVFNKSLSTLLSLFPEIVEQALGEFRKHYLMINRFDSYFNQGYPSDRYVQFMQKMSSEQLSVDIGKMDISKYGNEYLQGNLLLAYVQRIVLRSQNLKAIYSELRDEILLLCKLIANKNQ